jgi:cytochrome c-type biogenesis protein CcmF
MNYIGEHLLPGQIGYFLSVLSLVASFVATIAFYKAGRVALPDEKRSWFNMAKVAFLLETVSVIGMFCIIYYLISNHYFEYRYVFQHSSRSLDTKYLLSCFWEGQEGSFMLWNFWHCILGWIIILRGKEWAPGVMSVISFVQICLATMVLGVYFFHTKIGSSPFVLLRNENMLSPQSFPIGFTTEGLLRKDYLNFIRDGNGLNTLLQNYWMVIHPPVLFLGFASTVVPFAFAIDGLFFRRHNWAKPAIPWAAFSVGILGLGIMMGAAWAYESLTFGGYWAWDPVENASLVPWLVVVGGLHTNIIYKNSGYSLKTTYFLYVTGFVLVLYSTFLTRSGILGDTSVHAFTDLGMNEQLLLFLSLFIWLPSLVQAGAKTRWILGGIILLVLLSGYIVPAYTPLVWFTSLIGFIVFFGIQLSLNRAIPSIRKEEATWSREFWMFIGSLILLLAALIIAAKTSVPIFNKVFKRNIAQPEDVEFSYNRIQVFVAILLGLLTAVTQFFRYKQTPAAVFAKKLSLTAFISVVLTALIIGLNKMDYPTHGPVFLFAIYLALFAAVYAVVGNITYVYTALKGRMKNAGGSVAHTGFGLVLIGILVSASEREILSLNTTGISILNEKENPREKAGENITLFKGVATDMGKYMVTYARDTVEEKGDKKYFELVFARKDGKETFKLYPDVLKNNKQEGFSANPASRHYLTKDIFSYVTSWIEGTTAKDTTTFRPVQAKVGDTLWYSKGAILFKNVLRNSGLKNRLQPGEDALVLDLEVHNLDGRTYKATPAIAVKNATEMRLLPDTVMSQSLVLQFNKLVDPEKGLMEIGVKENPNMNDLLTLKVYEFPYINVLWLGIVVTVLGCFMSVRQRLKEADRPATVRKA